MGNPSDTEQEYELRELLSVNVDGAGYADAGIPATYPPNSFFDRFTWDTASDSVTETKTGNGLILFGNAIGIQLQLRVFSKGDNTLPSRFIGFISDSGFSFSSTSSNDRTTILTLQAANPPPSLDVDGNGTVGLLTDGLLLVRYLIGTRGSALTDGAAAGDAHEDRDTHQEIAAYLQGLVDDDVLDVDGNGAVGLLTDGLLMVRYLIGTRGPALTNGAAAGDAHEDRDSPEEIAAYLDSLMPRE